MSSILDQVHSAVGLDKVEILASALDHTRAELETLSRGRLTLEEQTAVIPITELAEKYKMDYKTLTANLRAVLGESAVFRFGRSLVIRQVNLLRYLEHLESQSQPQ